MRSVEQDYHDPDRVIEAPRDALLYFRALQTLPWPFMAKLVRFFPLRFGKIILFEMEDGRHYLYGKSEDQAFNLDIELMEDFPAELYYLRGQKVKQVIDRHTNFMFVTHGGMLFGWGKNAAAQITIYDGPEVHLPMLLSDQVTLVHAGDHFAIARSPENKYVFFGSWQRSDEAHLGKFDKHKGVNLQFYFHSKIIDVVCGGDFALVLCADGLYAFYKGNVSHKITQINLSQIDRFTVANCRDILLLTHKKELLHMVIHPQTKRFVRTTHVNPDDPIVSLFKVGWGVFGRGESGHLYYWNNVPNEKYTYVDTSAYWQRTSFTSPIDVLFAKNLTYGISDVMSLPFRYRAMPRELKHLNCDTPINNEKLVVQISQFMVERDIFFNNKLVPQIFCGAKRYNECAIRSEQRCNVDEWCFYYWYLRYLYTGEFRMWDRYEYVNFLLFANESSNYRLRHIAENLIINDMTEDEFGYIVQHSQRILRFDDIIERFVAPIIRERVRRSGHNLKPWFDAADKYQVRMYHIVTSVSTPNIILPRFRDSWYYRDAVSSINPPRIAGPGTSAESTLSTSQAANLEVGEGETPQASAEATTSGTSRRTHDDAEAENAEPSQSQTRAVRARRDSHLSSEGSSETGRSRPQTRSQTRNRDQNE